LRLPGFSHKIKEMANPNPVTEHLVKWSPGQSGNPSGRPKLSDAQREETLALLKAAVPRAAAFHAALIEHALRILERCRPTAQNPEGNVPLKEEAVIISNATKSAEIVFNRILGKVEADDKGKGESTALALLSLVREMVADQVKPIKIVETVQVSDICTRDQEKPALDVPSVAQNSEKLS
jgi:hypothetical protein